MSYSLAISADITLVGSEVPRFARVLWIYDIEPKGNSHLDDYLLLKRPIYHSHMTS